MSPAVADLSEPLSVYSSAGQLIDAMKAGALTAEDCLDLHLERYGMVNDTLNAVIRTDVAAARAAARRYDRMTRAGERAGPLHGVPMTVKDTFDVDGLPATAGAPEFAQRPGRTADAEAVARLRRAGAVIWGKSNTPYLGGDNQTDNPLFGRTLNPWDVRRTPGGSSGGSAAALAAGITPLELGSDMGGSLRVPAHFCGVFALRPTFGATPIRGHIPPAPGALTVRDMNVAGPMARHAADLRLLFHVLTGTAPTAVPATHTLEGRRIGLWCDEPGFFLAASARAAVNTVASALADAGADVRASRPPVAGEALMDLYLSMLLPALAADLPDRLVKALSLGRPIARALYGGEGFSRSKWALYSAAPHAEWIRNSERRAALKLDLGRYFLRHDVILAPVAPSEAFRHVSSGDAVTRRITVDGRAIPFHAFHAWTALASLFHLPAIVVPVPQAEGALPCGVQIIGPPGSDLTLIDIAEALEHSLSGGCFRRPPETAGIPAEKGRKQVRRLSVGRRPTTRSRYSAR